jgi:glycolate oxidase FAD binding subunit
VPAGRFPLAAVDLSATGVDWRSLDPAADHALAVDGVLPRTLARPRDQDQLSALLRYATANRLAVLPRGGGTKMALGNPPDRADILLSLELLNQVVEHEPQDLTVTVQAAMPLADLQQHLRRAGQYLPLNPPGGSRCTVGGVLATNANGPWRLGHGSTRDLVIGTKAVLGDGTVARAGGKVVKNVAGYDLNKLYIGSLGTLAVLLEVTFKLTPLPAAETTVLAAFRAPEEALAVVQRLVRSSLMPRAIVLLDRATGPAHGSLVSPAAFPLLVTYAGFPPVLARQAGETQQYCREAEAETVTVLDPDSARGLWDAVTEFPAAGQDVVAKLTVPPARVGAVFQTLREAQRSLDGAQGFVAQAQPASGIIYVRFGPGLGDAATMRALADLREACARLEGSLLLWSAGPELKRAFDPWGPSGYPLPLMRKLKQEFDPQQVLNPGRYVGGI